MKKILLILFLGLAVRGIAIVSFSSYRLHPQEDARIYDEVAVNLVSGKGYTIGGEPEVIAAPGYPFFLSGIYFLFGHSYAIVRIIQSLIALFSVFLIYRFIKKEAGEAPALITAAISAFYPYFIFRNMGLENETLSLLFNIIFIIFLVKAEKEKSYAFYLLAGLFFGISLLIRPAAILFPLFYPLALFIFFRREIQWRKFFLRWLTFTVIAYTVVSGWTLRNYLIFRQFIPVSGFSAGENLYAASLSYSRFERFDERGYKRIIPEGKLNWQPRQMLAAEKRFFSAAKRNILRHPALFFSSGLLGGLPNLCGILIIEPDWRFTQISYWALGRMNISAGEKYYITETLRAFWHIFCLGVLIFGLAGFYLFRRSLSFRPIIMFLTYTLFLHSFFSLASHRYFLPFFPFFIALAVASAFRLCAEKSC